MQEKHKDNILQDITSLLFGGIIEITIASPRTSLKLLKQVLAPYGGANETSISLSNSFKVTVN